MRLLILFFLFLAQLRAAQNNTWGGSSTSLFPNLAPNAVVISTAGTNGLTVINGNVSGSKVKFAAPIGTPSTNDNLMIRSNDGFVHISTYTVGDLLSLGGGGNNLANTDLTASGNRLSDWNSFSLGIFGLNGLSFTGSGGQLFDDSGGVILRSGSPQVQVTTSKVELKAIGSNKINFFTDAIQQGTATVGQFPKLSNTATGGWEWGDGTSPAGGNVGTVDTVEDLLSESTPIIITQGYYAVGDGGHAAYRYVSGDATATNTVTVFEGLAGRYFLMQSGSISAKQAGAVADGVTDDHDALQALFDACSGITARIDPGSYYSSSGFTQVDDLKVIARGAEIAIDTNGENGLKVGSRSIVDGGDWTSTALTAGSNGFDNSLFSFGNYTSAGGASNSVIKNVHVNVINATGTACSAIFIAGGCENITIDTVEFPDSATVDDVVTIHWGFVSGSEVNGTLHPHNIKVRNINVGELTSGTSDASPVFCSGSYDVSVENVTSRKARHGAIMVTGDFGFAYSGFTAQTLGAVSFKNITGLACSNIGLLAQGVGVASVVYPQQFLSENNTFFGLNNGSDTAGLYLNTTRNFTSRNDIFAGFTQGSVFTGGCLGGLIDASTFTTNRLAGILMDDATTQGWTIQNCKIYNNARTVSGTNAAGILLRNGTDVRLIGNKLGNVSGTEPNQETSITVAGTFVRATVSGNWTYGVKSGGINVAYSLGSVANAPTHLWVVSENSAATGVTLLTQPETLPYLVRGTKRTFTGTGTPTLGTFLVGERVTLDAATSTPFEKVCTVAGSPGTWSTSY